MSSKLFEIEIIHPKFDELYSLYKDGFNYPDYQKLMSEVETYTTSSAPVKPIKILSNKEYRKEISLLRKDYQILMNVVETFCEKPSQLDYKLNNFYVQYEESVRNRITDIFCQSSLNQSNEKTYRIIDNLFMHLKRPFSNLFSAEKELGGKVDWNIIRPEMSAMLGEIETLYQLQNASDILAKPDKQKQLNDVMGYLLELKEKTKKVREKQGRPSKPIPLEVTIKHSSPKEVVENTVKPKISLKSMEIKYDDNEAMLYIGTQKCQVPPYKNEHYLCRAMYEYNVNEPIDWSEIYEKITGYYEAYYGKLPATRANWRVVYDAMDAINKRTKEAVNTNDELFTWQEKTMKRNY